MTEYSVKNICTRCGNPVEITLRNKRNANFLRNGPCICDKCVPGSNWHKISSKGEMD